MRDGQILPLDETYNLVITSDNAANIGEQQLDQIKAPYSIVALSLCRVAIMEGMALGGVPVAALLFNFSDHKVWDVFVEAIQNMTASLGYSVPITGSTETNFPLPQSAFGLSIISKVPKHASFQRNTPNHAAFAVIGEPLVGEEVLTKQEDMAPLRLFQQLLNNEHVYEILPVGSRGIEQELNTVLEDNHLPLDRTIMAEVNVQKSAGPSSCFIISYNKEREEEIQLISGNYFHSLLLVD
ncbi:ATPase [Pontibacillus salicampi]|uniref:ATPase n=1 Tax=Pontibacillus salicampi TaxID=1449801 RepID=A0ABV6LK73_9BACI